MRYGANFCIAVHLAALFLRSSSRRNIAIPSQNRFIPIPTKTAIGIPLPMILPPIIPGQMGQSILINGILFVVLMGATLFAICRSSRRN